MNIPALRAGLLAVSAYKDILDESAMRAALRLLSALSKGKGEAALDAYTSLFYSLKAVGFPGLGAYLAHALRWSEGPYPRLAETGGADAALAAAAEHDIAAFARLAAVSGEEWAAALSSVLGEEFAEALAALPRLEGSVPFSFEGLTEQYRAQGAGKFARYRAFVWEDGALIPVPRPDCPGADELLGYARQRAALWDNTRLLLCERRVNNVLLYGESGTGKSAAVKSLLSLPGTEELRIIEADKSDLAGLPALIRSLDGRRQKFILFIDDLAFDRDDTSYSILKTILEGGLERRPDNVAVYATSNRRHLVRQTFSDRAGDEVNRNETIQEKTSLADRFGVRIRFESLTKPEYLATVDMLAGRYGVAIEPEELHRQAVAWERLHAAQTPRSALQFILSLTQ